MEENVCPVWVGYILISPFRKLWQNPKRILGPFIRPGMRILDIGCAMGFFSLPMAEMAGDEGCVICVDLQEKMLERLMNRAKRAGLASRIELRTCDSHSLKIDDLNGTIDFALAFAVVHEMPDSSIFLTEVHNAIKPGGKLLIAEPKGHVSKQAFEKILDLAGEKGFLQSEEVRIPGSRSFLLKRK